MKNKKSPSHFLFSALSQISAGVDVGCNQYPKIQQIWNLELGTQAGPVRSWDLAELAKVM